MINTKLTKREKDYPVINFKRVITGIGIIAVILAVLSVLDEVL